MYIALIQKGLDPANGTCWTALVANGAYKGAGNKDLDFKGKAVHLKSVGGAANCIIDCEGSGRGFYFHSGETNLSILEGFTIRNGNPSGVDTRDGGGIYCYNSSPKIVGCTIAGNTASYGGGINIQGNPGPLITNCTISGNTATEDGGGISSVVSGSLTIANCVVTGNKADAGGGIRCASSSGTISNCTIVNNEGSSGGGICCVESSITMANCTIASNLAGYGGGIHCYRLTPSIINCTIVGNVASQYGGGIRCYESSPTITNCTVANNTAGGSDSSDGYGGGFYCESNSDPVVNNTILWGNSAKTGGRQVYTYDTASTVILNYCDYANRTLDPKNIEGSGAVTANNCIVADPLFADPVIGDYHLRTNPTLSPCVDAGSNSLVPAGVTTDLDANPRIVDGNNDSTATVDIGAYEYQPSGPPQANFTAVPRCGDAPITVQFTDESTGTVTSWSWDFDSDGTVDSTQRDPAYTYTNSGTFAVSLTATGPDGSDDEVKECYIIVGPMYVDATNGDDANDGSGWAKAVKTIQKGLDLAGTVGCTVPVADGTYTGADNKDLDFKGKVIHLKSAGGAANCIIDCENSGRGFYFHTGETNSAVVEGFTIQNGVADPGGTETRGGGILCSYSSPTIVNCVIANNRAGGGGGIHCGASSPIIINCIIANNSRSGISCERYSSPTLTNCTIANNTSSYGGGLTYYYDSHPVLNNTILWGNTATSNGNQLYSSDSASSVTLDHCCYADNTLNPRNIEGSSTVTPINSIVADPLFVDAPAGDYYLRINPILSPCIDAGDDSFVPAAVTADLEGNPRIQNSTVDIGAYEYQPSGLPQPNFTATPIGGDAPAIIQFRDQSMGNVTSRAWDFDNDGTVDSAEREPTHTYTSPGTYTVKLTVSGPDGSDSIVKSNYIVVGPLYVDGANGNDTNDGFSWATAVKTIQRGLDLAGREGCTVLVANGTYTGTGNKELDLRGKAIHLKSVGGAANCIIDCENSGRGFYFHTSETASSVVEDFTIQNGTGSGIYCLCSNPTISDCILTNNSGNGGGICCSAGSNPTIVRCTIRSNRASSAGGGIACSDGSSPTITDCTISGNRVSYYGGGGIYCNSESNPTITNCIITGNTAYESGGGICCYSNSNPTITNCIIADNKTTTYSANYGGGGGIYCNGSSPRVINCTITGNSATLNGGAICCEDNSSPEMTNCTIVNNRASWRGGGIYCWYNSSATLNNTIMWTNSAGAAEGHQVYAITISTVTLNYCDYTSGPLDVIGTVTANNCINSDPLFVDAVSGDYHLQISPVLSPCIDAGDNLLVPVGVITDLDGNPRIQNGTVDIGAYEYQPSGLPHANFTAAPKSGDAPLAVQFTDESMGTVTSWAWDFDNDGTVDSTERNPTHTYTNSGIYTVKLTVGGPDGSDSKIRESYIYVGPMYVNGASGNDANSGSSWATAVKTIQKGLDIAGSTDCTVLVANGTYTGTGNKQIDFKGKAVHLKSVGGAVNCIIDCENSGRGFYFYSGETVNSVVEGFTIRNGNAGSSYGGGAYIWNSSPTIINCILTNNKAGFYSGGGSIYCGGSSNPTIVNCLIANNTAGTGAGIGCEYNCTPTIINCTIAGNMASSNGGGILCRSGSTPTIDNTIIWGNSATSNGNQIYTQDAACAVTLNYCDYANGANDVAGTGIVTANSCINSDPLFVDAANGNYRLQSISPCKEAGNNDLICYDYDLDGNPRLEDGDSNSVYIVDIGAYEYQTGGNNVPIVTILSAPSGVITDDTPTFTYSGSDSDGTVAGYWVSIDTFPPDIFTTDANWTCPPLASGSHIFYVQAVDDDGARSLMKSSQVFVYDPTPETRLVPEEYSTIQQALEYAENGQTVLVANGTYTGSGNKNLDFKGKNIHLRSVAGAANCIIDCENSGRGLYLHTRETNAAIVEGFAIQNGSAESGSGIFCSSSSPVITDCVIRSSSARSGGGIYCGSASNLVIINCTIANNTASEQGGGICCSYSTTLAITNCIIENNTATASGGGIYCDDSNPTITNCIIARNTVTGSSSYGGGIYCDYSNPAITNCAIEDNSSARDGGGIYCNESNPLVTNCIVAKNTATQRGGGIFCVDADPRLNNVILWDNSAGSGGNQIYAQNVYCAVRLNYCCYADGMSDIEGAGTVTPNNCINSDPLFVDTAGGDYHMQSASPCIDAGNNSLVPAGVTTDLDGNPRIAGTAVDMGAYEYQP